MTKQCAYCKEHKDLREYSLNDYGRPISYCRVCHNHKNKQRKMKMIRPEKLSRITKVKEDLNG